MRELVRHHARVGSLLAERRRLLVHEHQEIAERHGAGVLHRAALVRHGDDVELVVRVFDPEELLERRQDLAGVRHRVRDLLAVPLRRHAAQRERVLANGVRRDVGGGNDLERPDRERDQVARQRKRRREVNAERAAVGLPIDLVRVRDRLRVRRDDQRRVERDLEARLVEARERAARRDRLELREGVRDAGLRDLVEPFELRPERRIELDVQLRFPCGQRQRKGDRRHPRLVALLPRPRDFRAAVGRRRRARHVERLAVKPHDAPRLIERDRDIDRAREAILLRIDVQLERLGRRTRVARQSNRGNRFGARRGGRRGGARRRCGRRRDGRRGRRSARRHRERAEENQREEGEGRGSHFRARTLPGFQWGDGTRISNRRGQRLPVT